MVMSWILPPKYRELRHHDYSDIKRTLDPKSLVRLPSRQVQAIYKELQKSAMADSVVNYITNKTNQARAETAARIQAITAPSAPQTKTEENELARKAWEAENLKRAQQEVRDAEKLRKEKAAQDAEKKAAQDAEKKAAQDALARKAAQDALTRKAAQDASARKAAQDVLARKAAQDALARKAAQDASARKVAQDA